MTLLRIEKHWFPSLCGHFPTAPSLNYLSQHYSGSIPTLKLPGTSLESRIISTKILAPTSVSLFFLSFFFFFPTSLSQSFSSKHRISCCCCYSLSCPPGFAGLRIVRTRHLGGQRKIAAAAAAKKQKAFGSSSRISRPPSFSNATTTITKLGCTECVYIYVYIYIYPYTSTASTTPHIHTAVDLSLSRSTSLVSVLAVKPGWPAISSSSSNRSTVCTYREV